MAGPADRSISKVAPGTISATYQKIQPKYIEDAGVEKPHVGTDNGTFGTPVQQDNAFSDEQSLLDERSIEHLQRGSSSEVAFRRQIPRGTISAVSQRATMNCSQTQLTNIEDDGVEKLHMGTDK